VYPCELFLEIANQIRKIDIELRWVDGVEKTVGGGAIRLTKGPPVSVPLGGPGNQVGDVGGEGKSVLIEPDGRNEIEPEEREVGQVVA
jgi:hypothetical protein